MRKIIFLDFDGVLHPDGIAKFSRLPVLERFLVEMPDAEVVVSSTWREDHTLDQLRDIFSPPLRSRITGVTPSLDDGYDLKKRKKEVFGILLVLHRLPDLPQLLSAPLQQVGGVLLFLIGRQPFERDHCETDPPNAYG